MYGRTIAIESFGFGAREMFSARLGTEERTERGVASGEMRTFVASKTSGRFLGGWSAPKRLDRENNGG